MVLLFTSIVSYYGALAISKDTNDKRALYLFGGICLATLILFKYYPFTNLLMPVGISFYTFRILSYLIDVSRGKVEAEKSIGRYASYVAFFPHLIAGPIERSGVFFEDLDKEKRIEDVDIEEALYLIIRGLFKKLVVADTLAKGVDATFADLGSYEGAILLFVSFLYTIQIYCDFSGYSDMAVGIMRLLGMGKVKNFETPYFSDSLGEFWKNWHISLSTWFRDYVYIPLGGNRKGIIRRDFNLLVTFILSGAWHGKDVTFLIWGGIHGLVQLIEKHIPTGKKKNSCVKTLSILITFLIVNFAWIFFRAPSMKEAGYFISHMFTGIGNPVQYIKSLPNDIYFEKKGMLVVGFELVLLFALDFIQYMNRMKDRRLVIKPVVRKVLYLALALIVVFFSSKGVTIQFIYAQF